MHIGYIGIGIITETEVGVKINIVDQLYVEGGIMATIYPKFKRF